MLGAMHCHGECQFNVDVAIEWVLVAYQAISFEFSSDATMITADVIRAGGTHGKGLPSESLS